MIVCVGNVDFILCGSKTLRVAKACRVDGAIIKACCAAADTHQIIAAFVAAEVLTALTSGARAAGDTEEAALLEAAQ